MNLFDVVRDIAGENANATAVVADGTSLTYRELVGRIDVVSQRLDALLPTEAPLVVSADSSLFGAVVLLAAMRTGRAVVPVNPPDVVALPDVLPGVRPVAVLSDALPAASSPWPVVTPEHLSGDVPIAVGAWSRDEHVLPGEAAAVFLTSGTSGRPRAAVHTHASLLRTLAALSEAPPSSAGQEVYLTTLKLHFIGGFAILSRVLGRGDRLVLVDDVHPRRLLERMERERATCLGIVPPLLGMLLRIRRLDRFDLTSLGIVGVGSSPLPAAMAQEARQRFHAMVVNSYGSTELGGPVLISLDGDPCFDALPGVEVDVVSSPPHDDRRSSEAAELHCRVQPFMLGYLTAEGVEPACSADGWYATGDRAVSKGQRVELMGRLDDLAFRGGANVELGALDEELGRHPHVGRVAAVAVPGRAGEDEIWAFVVLDRAAPGPAVSELTEWCRTSLPPALRPDRVKAVEDLPTTSNGKVIRSELRSLAPGEPL